MKFLKYLLPMLFVLLLSYFAVNQLLISGFFPMHDDTQVARVFEMGKALKDGMFPVRWVADLGYGYGYPIFNFYAPLSYYAGGLFTVFGFDALLATKIMMGIAIILSGIFMYLLARELFGKLGGVISALFYLYAPYHAVDIFIRGDVAEFWAYAFIPLAFYGLLMVYRYQKWRFVVIGSLGYAGIILSHNLTAMMVTPFILIAILLNCYIAYHQNKLATIYYLISTIFIGILVSAFYWVPALLEMQYTNVLSQIGGGANFRDHFVCINQLWDSPWGFGGSAPGCVDGLSLKIGKIHLIFSILSLLILFAKKQIEKEKRTLLLFVFSSFFLSIFLTQDVSRTLWQAIWPMEFIQYPWRFLLLIAFFSSLLAGFFIQYLQIELSRLKYRDIILSIGTGFIVFLLLYFNTKLFLPQTIISKKAIDYTNKLELNFNTSKISDEYMPKDFSKQNSLDEIIKEKISVLQGSVRINSLRVKTQEINALVYSEGPSIIKINIAYFPFWEILIDSNKVLFKAYSNGIIVSLPEGHHTVIARISQTTIEKIANILSIAGVSILAVGIIYGRKKLI